MDNHIYLFTRIATVKRLHSMNFLDTDRYIIIQDLRTDYYNLVSFILS